MKSSGDPPLDARAPAAPAAPAARSAPSSERRVGQQRVALRGAGEQVAVDRHEPVDVVHVAVEVRDEDRVVVADLALEPLDRRGVAARRGRGTRRSVRATLRGELRVPAELLRERAGVGLAPRRASSGCTRLTISPPNGIPRSRSLPRKKIASSTGSRSGEVTMRNVVAGSASSALTPAARSRKPSIRPPARGRTTLRSWSRSTPVTRLSTQKTTLVPRPMTFAARPRRREEQPQRAALEEAGQPVRRVEEVERVARRRRVEHEHVEAPGAVQLVELGDRRELLRAGDRARELLVDPVVEDLVARRARRAPGAR